MMTRTLAGLAALAWLLGLAAAQQPENVSRGSKNLLRLASAPLEWTPPQEGRDYRRLKTEAGTTFYFKEDHLVPMVSVFCRVGAGALFEAGRTRHAAKVTARMLRECGSSSMTPESLESALDYYAGSLDITCGFDWVDITASIPSRHLDTLVKILGGLLASPAFSEEKLAYTVKRMQAEEGARSDDPFHVARKTFFRLLYPGHPYGSLYDYDGLEKVALPDVQKFHADMYGPANLRVAVSGDCREKAFLDLWERYYLHPPANRPLTVPAPPPPKCVPGVYLVPRNVNQSSIYFGSLLPEGVRAEIPLLNLMNHMTGGGDFASRFTQQVRDKEGLAYRVDSLLDLNVLSYPAYIARCRTKTSSTERAVDALRWILDLFREGRFTENEFLAGKSALRTGLVRQFTSEQELLKMYLTMDLLGRPPSFVADYPAQVQAITPEQLAKISEKCFDPARLVYVVVGQADALEKGLKKFGPVKIVQ